MSNNVMIKETKSESANHRAIKQKLQEIASLKSQNVIKTHIEKYLKTRRADVYLTLKSGKKIAIEIQHSYITLDKLRERTKEYNEKGIYVLWILDGNGKCVAQPRFPEDKRTVKISATEKFLHKSPSSGSGTLIFCGILISQNTF